MKIRVLIQKQFHPIVNNDALHQVWKFFIKLMTFLTQIIRMTYHIWLTHGVNVNLKLHSNPCTRTISRHIFSSIKEYLNNPHKVVDDQKEIQIRLQKYLQVAYSWSQSPFWSCIQIVVKLYDNYDLNSKLKWLFLKY